MVLNLEKLAECSHYVFKKSQEINLGLSDLGERAERVVMNTICLLVFLVAIVFLYIAMESDRRYTGALAILGGGFTISVIRFISKRPRPFFPRMGMAVFGSLLLVWALFRFGS
jgi:hypothetical protein